MVKVWYDYKRQCYVSNAAFIAAKHTGIPAPVIAAYLADLLMYKLPDIVEKAWVS